MEELIHQRNRESDVIPGIIIAYLNEIQQYFQKWGFIHRIQLPLGYLNKIIDGQNKKGKILFSEEDKLINISHGGGFYYLIDLFSGQSDGYSLENYEYQHYGYGIQVSPEYRERDRHYALSRARINGDDPCVLEAKIHCSKLLRAPCGYEAGLPVEHMKNLTDIVLTNLATHEKITAANFDELTTKLQLRNKLQTAYTCGFFADPTHSCLRAHQQNQYKPIATYGLSV